MSGRPLVLESSELDCVVDGYVERVLELSEQIEDGQPLEASRVHAQLLQHLREAAALLGEQDDWLSAQYALVAWTDELLLDLPWEGRVAWNNMVLEVERFGTRVAGEEFFRRAREAANRGALDVLRVYYTAVLLGFRGVYAHQDVDRWAELGLPASLSDWLAETHQRLTVQTPRLEPAAVQRRIAGAEPLDLRTRIMWLSVLAIGLLTLNLTIYRLTS
jgi:type VI secretion system protein ImpK